MTGDEAKAIRAAYADYQDDDTKSLLLDLLDQVMMWQRAAGSDGLDDLRNLSRVARGERRGCGPVHVEVPCDCHCCQKMAAAEARAAADEESRRRIRVRAILAGWRP